MNEFRHEVKRLEEMIEATYSEGVTMEQAQAYSARFLVAQLAVSEELRKLDLDSRMRKTGLKAIRAAVYLDEVKKNERKPSDVLLEAMVNSNELVIGEQKRFDESEAERDELERLYNVFGNAHIHFRTIGKGSLG